MKGVKQEQDADDLFGVSGVNESGGKNGGQNARTLQQCSDWSNSIWIYAQESICEVKLTCPAVRCKIRQVCRCENGEVKFFNMAARVQTCWGVERT